jgi:hypothetical protein
MLGRCGAYLGFASAVSRTYVCTAFEKLVKKSENHSEDISP